MISTPGQAEQAYQAIEPLIPLASVMHTQQATVPTLPFTTDSVNLVIMGDNSPFSAEEARRVLAPEGVLLSGASLSKETMPQDERYGSWAHFYGDPHDSNTTSDELVGPSTSLRWLSQNMPAGALRAAGGVVVTAQDSFSIRNVDSSYRGPRTRGHLAGRDAFSGVVLWHNEDATNTKMIAIRNMLTGHDLGFIHPQGGFDQPIVLTDRHTGDIIVSYDEGIRYPREVPRNLVGKDNPEFGKGGRKLKSTLEG